MPTLLLPKFLSKRIALFAMEEISKVATRFGPFKRNTFHLVMIVPAMQYTQGNYPNYPLIPHLLAEYTHGDKDTWEHDFTNIAQCKTLQSWHGRATGNSDASAHLLLQGDTPYYGSVFRDGIACGCSGVQPYFDKMMAGMVIDGVIAMAQHEKTIWLEKNPKEDFLPEGPLFP